MVDTTKYKFGSEVADKLVSSAELDLEKEIELIVWGEKVRNAKFVGVMVDRVTGWIDRYIFEYYSVRGIMNGYIKPKNLDRKDKTFILRDFTEVDPNLHLALNFGRGI